MQSMVPLACFLSVIRPPGVQYENALLQIAPVDKSKCPFVKDSSDIGFQLFTRHNPTVYQELVAGDDERLFASNMDFGAPTVVYFHAFMEQPDDGSGIMLREAYMQRGDTNVIMVDAHRLEAGPWYFTAAQNTWYIGRFAAAFVDYMVSRGLQLNSTHFVGHSLGAQAAGVAGSALATGRVSRITGLDPALPLFSGLPLEQRLDTTDAHFVDVIHTDAGIFGYKEPIGHADFFPNGGKSPQPGCELEVVIPQQLLLNKCDGTEQTRGFYSYYLTSHKNHPHDSKDYSDLNQIKPLQIGSKRIKLNSTRVDTKEFDRNHVMEHIRRPKSLEKKSKINTNVDIHSTHNVRYFTSSNNNLRKNRVNRDVKTLVADTHEVSKKGEQHLNIHTATNDTQTDEQRTPVVNVNNNETTTQVSDNRKHPHDVKHNGKQVKDDVKKIKPPNSWVRASNGQTTNNQAKITKSEAHKHTDRHAKKRQKRFLQLFSRSDNEDNFIFRALNFLVKNRKSVIPIISVVRDINTLVKSGNGELNHVSKERNNYVGIAPPQLAPVTYSLELGNESKLMAFVKRLFGLTPKGDRLTIGSG